jgi:hypothetical protein
MKSYLQQYKFWGLMKNSFSVYFRFFFKFFVIVAVFELPVLILRDIIFSYGIESNGLNTIIIPVIIATVFVLIASYFAYFALIGEISEICFGNPVSISKALSRVSFRGVGRLLSTVILFLVILFIAFFGPIVLGLILSAILGKNPSVNLIIPYVIIGILLTIYILIRYFFVAQVVILERVYWWKALKRSANISRSHFWKIFSYLILYFIIIIIPIYIFRYVPRTNPDLLKESILIMGITSSIVTVATLPLMQIVLTLFYYSLRIENYDLSMENLVDIKSYEAI